jgi:hypothetical protein
VFLGDDPELGSGADPHGGGPGGGFGLSVKLPSSGMVALSLSFARPTGYGLGRAGWVSAEFGPKEDIPLPMLRDWIAESYRAVAPKTLVRQLEAAGAGATPAARPRRRSAGAPAPRERRRRIGS